MSRLMPIAAALAALLWSASAWAVVATSQVSIQSSAGPVPNATVTLTPTAGTSVTRTPTATRRTSSTGQVTIRHETRDPPTSTFTATVVDEEGRTYTGVTTLRDIASGAPINVTPASGAPTGPIIGLGLGGQTTGCDNWQTTGIVSVVADPIGENPNACFSSAFRGSIYLGYAHRVGSNWLAGIEADIGFTNSSKTIAGIPGTVNGMPNVTPAVAANDSVKVEKDWDFSLRGRFGYFITPRTVAYATGGVAFQRMEATLNCTALGACGTNGLPVFSSTQSKTLTGWTLGGGVEVSLTDRIVGRAEYRYADYGTYTATFQGPTTTSFTADIDMRTHTALVGIGLKLGGGN